MYTCLYSMHLRAIHTVIDASENQKTSQCKVALQKLLQSIWNNMFELKTIYEIIAVFSTRCQSVECD